MEHMAATTTMESSTGYFLQQVYTSLTHDLPIQTLNTAMLSTYVNPQNIDRMVEMEMKRIKENCSRKEQQYVEQMLLENPITIERRTIVNRHQAPPQQQEQLQQPNHHHHPYSLDVAAAVRKDTNTLLPIDEQQHQLQQQQRAEACRRSRYNNKIKKAKTKYRHKYMSQKLLQSTQMFDCIQDLIAQAETHLLTQGLSQDKLHQLRHSYGMNQSRDTIRQMEHIMKTEH